jgi:cytochrome P450
MDEEVGLNEARREDWDPRDASVLDDQRAAYDRMREQCPVAYSEFMGWSLFRHQDVLNVLADPRAYSSVSRHPAIPSGMDPPHHTRHRDAIAPNFDDARMDALEPRCRAIAEELAAPLVGTDAVELVETFATPFALRTLCALLGWPEELWECLGGWTHGNQQAAFTRDPAAGRALAKLLDEHVKTNLDAHHGPGHPADDVTDALLATTVDGTPLDDDAIVSVLRNWIAGEGTVAGGLSLAVLHLAQRRELQDQLRADAALIPAAVEELLRFDDPLVANRRTTTRPVEIGGRSIGQGENLTLMWIAANRDPRAFDGADEIRLDRQTDASLVWGHGIHECLGAPLARLEIRIALEELLQRTKRIELAGEPRRAIYPSDGLAALPIRLA